MTCNAKKGFGQNICNSQVCILIIKDYYYYCRHFWKLQGFAILHFVDFLKFRKYLHHSILALKARGTVLKILFKTNIFWQILHLCVFHKAGISLTTIICLIPKSWFSKIKNFWET